MVELQLMSACSVGKDLAAAALVYRLDEEGGARGLPVVRETHPWAGKTVSALRDRLMIQWVTSFPESKKLVEKMVDEITAVVLRSGRSSAERSKSASNVVRVVVICSSGAQLSPCFVERLYDHFSCGPPLVSGLTVTRYHRDALRGRSKHLVWQVSCIPSHSKAAPRFHEVFRSIKWHNFDPTANSRSETQFKKDPFNSSVDFADMTLDFGSGTAYRKAEGKTYYIRCSDVSQSKANCWILSGTGYKSASSTFRAAGIQPYSIHPLTGEAVFLLGRLTYGPWIWCDFGGLKSSRFRREGPRLTAARECYEETLGVLGTTRQLADALIDFKTNNCFKVVNVETQYVEHFMRIPYKDYPTLFKRRLREMADKRVEVDQMKWFPLSSLKSAAVMACSDQYGVTQQHIKVKALTEDGAVDESRAHNLREPYVGTLCIADALNFLDSIAAIAEREHRQQHDPSQSHRHTEDRLSTAQSETVSPAGGHESTITEESAPHEDSKLSAHEPAETSMAQTDSGSSEQTSDIDREAVEEDNSSSGGDLTDCSSCSEDAEQLSSGASNSETLSIESKHKEKSTSPGIKSKLFKLSGRRKKRPKRHKDYSHPSKVDQKRRNKHTLLYEMGAGSFTGMESYMNT